MSWLAFAGLTILYLAVAVGIVYLIAMQKVRSGSRPDKSVRGLFSEYLWNNNTLWFAGVGMFLITLIIACFNFGPAVLLPENVPSKEQRGGMGNFFNHLLHGKNAEAESIPTSKLPWATGTWFWWKADLAYALFTFAYFWYAFWDEASHACHAVANFIRERRERLRREEAEHRQHNAAAGHGHREDHHAGGSGLRMFSFAFLAEILGSFVVEFLEHRRRRNP